MDQNRPHQAKLTAVIPSLMIRVANEDVKEADNRFYISALDDF